MFLVLESWITLLILLQTSNDVSGMMNLTIPMNMHRIYSQFSHYLNTTRSTGPYVTCNIVIPENEDKCSDDIYSFIEASKCAKFIFSSKN